VGGAGLTMTNSEYQQLVEFLGQRFAEVDRRFYAIEHSFEARFDVMEAQLRDILGHFDEVYTRLDRLEQEYQAILQALRRIEARLATEQERREILELSVDELKRQVVALQARIEELEQRIRR
jgi:chromosome segregation ATPase